MKNFKKITVLFVTLLGITYSYTMEERLDYIEKALANFEDDIEDLKNRVATLETSSTSQEQPTFEKCAPDGTACTKVRPRKAYKILAQRKPNKRIRRCHKGVCDWVTHGEIQKKFQSLQQQADITSSGKISDIKKVGQQFADQQEFNRLRSQLNTLLAKDTLSQADINQINTLIAEFESKRPARRPSPEDYKQLLQKKLSKQ